MSTTTFKEVLENAAALGDAILHSREIAENTDRMAKLLKEARQIEPVAPARAQALRKEAHSIVLA